MGGINHQPCGSYLPESTRLSREISLAHASLELGNVALEDLILMELDGKVSTLEPLLTRLAESTAYLEATQEAITSLKDKMSTLGYEDLPPLQRINWDSFGDVAIEDGLVEAAAWTDTVDLFMSRGFYGMLEYFESVLLDLVKKTRELARCVTVNKAVCAHGDLNLVLEENRQGNFRVQFAALYTAWNQFRAHFLASALISTEIWYRHTQRSGLLGHRAVSVRAA